jgi:hypothetical protein
VQLNPRVTSETTPLLAAISETDSAGRFRLQGLPPGSYYIAAGLLQSPTYYPGVASLTAARAVVIAGDAVKAGLDFNLDPIVFEDFADAKQVPMQPGSIRSTDQAVTDATKLAVRQVLQARDHRMWWAARVLELLKDGRVKVRYIGWDERFDEVVPRSRLQLDDQAIEKARRRAEWTGQKGMGPLPGVVFIPSPHTRSGSGVVQFNGEPVIANSLLNRYSLPFTSTLILTGSALVSWIVLTLFRRIRAPAEAPVVIRLKSD